MEDDRMLGAIGSLLATVRSRDDRDEVAAQRQIDCMRSIAQRVRDDHEREMTAVRTRIASRLLPVDPLHQGWNVFRLFDVAYDEVRWTQWFAAILRADNGTRCASLIWRAFCDAVSRRAAPRAPVGDNVATSQTWERISDDEPQVEDEVGYNGLGRVDLLFTTSSIVAAVENKIWAGWHDGPTTLQADRYREIAQRRLAGDATRKLGLVLLSARNDITPEDYPPDYVHVHWRDVGQALRRRLAIEWDDNQATTVALWPVVITLVSIEQDLLSLSLDPTEGPSKQLERLGLLATYLEGT